MTQKTQVIILAVLLVMVGVVAYFTFAGGKKQSTAQAAAPAADSSKDGDKAKINCPSSEDVRHVAAWFSPDEQSVIPKTKSPPPVFGLEPKPEAAARKADGTIAAIVEPPKLQGIFRVSSVPMAVFDGASYQAGQRIRGKPYVVVAVTDDTVRLRGDDGREVTISCHK